MEQGYRGIFMAKKALLIKSVWVKKIDENIEFHVKNAVFMQIVKNKWYYINQKSVSELIYEL